MLPSARSAVWALAVLVGLLAVARADLPIHCLHRDALGVWEFDLGANTADRSETCGYLAPDSNVQHFTSYTYKLQVANTIKVQLSHPNVAKVVGTDKVGTWTMVYDEGFEVRVDGKIFFAFFAYEPKSVAQLKSTKVADYTSHCDRTMVGWFHDDDNRRWGCFRAQKPGVAAWHPPQYANARAHNRLGADAVVAPAGALLEVSASTNLEMEAAASANLFLADDEFVSSINANANSLWTARVPTEFADYSNDDMHRLVGRSTFNKARLQSEAAASVHGSSGSASSSSILLETESSSSSGAGSLLKGTGSHFYSQQDAEMEKQHKLPRSVDWRNVQFANGATRDWTGPTRSQGHCGSCYAFAAAAVAESRIRIASKGGDQTVLSTQHMLSCSRTNQGCLGGYPYLLAKHAHEFGFVPETCLPYRPRQAQCSESCSDSDVYFASPDYGYIGGYYGASSEAAMMKEVAEHGPIIVAIQAPRSLFYYQSGIFEDNGAPKHEPGWEQTNHAVAVVGYGVDDSQSPPVKYWIVHNTWGGMWGDQGHFKIVRGSNCAAIESMPVYFRLTPKVSRSNLTASRSQRPQPHSQLLEMRQVDALQQHQRDWQRQQDELRATCVAAGVCQ